MAAATQDFDAVVIGARFSGMFLRPPRIGEDFHDARHEKATGLTAQLIKIKVW